MTRVISLLFLVLVCTGINSLTAATEETLTVSSDTAWFQYGFTWNPEPIPLTAKHDTLVRVIHYEYQYDGSPQPVLFFGDGDTLTFSYHTEPIAIHIKHNDKGATFQFYYMSQEKPARFPSDYEDANRGRPVFEVPEIYELANIAIAITNYGIENPWRVWKQGAYYKDVITHFQPYADHPLITAIEFSDERIGDYYSFRDNAICYEFGGDSIMANEIYPYVRIPNLFLCNIDLLQDFVRLTEFRDFYREHHDFYRAQENAFCEKTDLTSAWAWLEKRFPQRHDSYRVVFSPLINASHATAKYRDRESDFIQTVMLVGGPDLWADSYDGPIHDAMLTRMIFTEIDHNYVNPTTKMHLPAIEQAFHPTENWQLNSGYNSTWAIFNEYVTWALFVLYAQNGYPPLDFEVIKKDTEQAMIGRGFPRFPEFSQYLLKISTDEAATPDIPALYPKIIDWADSVSSSD